MSETRLAQDDDLRNGAASRSLSGRKVVAAMFAFGIAATAGMWVYWKLHVAPFVALQQALAQEFEDSRPLVEGGQRKMHKDTPRILRITMHAPFNPVANREQTLRLGEQVLAFVRAREDLTRFAELHLYLYSREGDYDFFETCIRWELPDGPPRIEPAEPAA
jgi:hypothetical protein